MLACLHVDAQSKKISNKSLPNEKLVETFNLKKFIYKIYIRQMEEKDLSWSEGEKEGMGYVVYLISKGSKFELLYFPKQVKNSRVNKICRESNYEFTNSTFTVHKRSFAYHFGASEETTVYEVTKYGGLEKKSETIKNIDLDTLSDEYIKHLTESVSPTPELK
jgi:hypothetical protein